MATRRSNDSQRTAKSSASVPPGEVLSSEKPLGGATAPKSAPRRRPTSAKKTEQPADAIAAKSVRVDVPEEARRAMVAESAYLRAERRGFHPGYEVEDWLAAEAEVDALLSAKAGGAQ